MRRVSRPENRKAAARRYRIEQRQETLISPCYLLRLSDGDQGKFQPFASADAHISSLILPSLAQLDLRLVRFSLTARNMSDVTVFFAIEIVLQHASPNFLRTKTYA